MSWLLIAVFIVLGLAFLVLEILVIPGAGFAGVIGFALITVAVWQTYAQYGSIPGHLVLAGTFVLTLLTLIFSLRSRTWKKIALSAEINSKVNVIEGDKIKLGDEGVTTSRLVPMGKALINGEFYEVRTTGAFIDQQSTIIVEKIDNNKIYVKLKEQEL
jgi:membrane-bound ClpP family serine protease